jgi:molybdopterin-dependent oxidoreductase alpha subunit
MKMGNEPNESKCDIDERDTKISEYSGAAGGWGSAASLAEILLREGSPVSVSVDLVHQNKPDGFMCVSCAWAKPAKPHPFEYCENGAKASAWEMTHKKTGPDFFAAHTVTELAAWPDYDLEEHGRLTHPMRWDAASDRYVPVDWDAAFAEIGRELKSLDPQSVVLYTSGRASLEASYMYQLFARMYGTNNLPDSSNMCHESTSVALPESIGVPVGTVRLDDFDKTDCIFFFGQNVGTNSPRMLHQLQDARMRGIEIITFNPLRERGLERFINPQSPFEMLTNTPTQISTQYHQVKAGGDTAALFGICKALIAVDDRAIVIGAARILDLDFIAGHTHGFEEFCAAARAYAWAQLEMRSGLPRSAMEEAAEVYARSNAVIGIYGMGLTQHRAGVDNCKMLANLLLLRGNIGKPGAGICPVRGHSNVQGQRTVGITEKPELVPLDRLKELYGFEPPREKGLNTVEACESVISGEVKAFVALGGNFIRAVPETQIIEEAWPKLRLTVQISTKLNRSHLIHGEVAFILPCLGRTDIDRQVTGPQAVSVEDSTACIHGSRGIKTPVADTILSEPKIVAEIAKHTLAPNTNIDWDAWVADYAKVREAIEATYPEQFKDFNKRMFEPGGFPRPNPARERQWKTETGKANFHVALCLNEDPDMASGGDGVFQLITLRSNDQFNTTIYGYDDRFRGVNGTRRVLMMNPADITRLSLQDGDAVDMATVARDGIERRLCGFRLTAYDIPNGCCWGYYPECNPLIPLWHHAERSKVPAAKSIPITISRTRPA